VPDPNQGQIVSTAWEWLHGGGPTDNVFTSQALLYLFRDGGYQEYADGGRLFEYTVEYATNVTFRSYSEMSILDTTRIDVFDAARYEQKIYAGTVVFSDLEALRNAVANRKVDVIKAKLKNGTNSAMEGLNAMLYGDGTGNSGLDMDGVAKIISSTPTVGSVGGINAGTWSFWRNKQSAATNTATAFDNLEAALRSVYNQCSLGGTEKIPTGLVTDRNTFQGYESLLVDIERLVKDGGGEADPDLGWLNDALQFKGCPMVYDEACPSATAYFVNRAYLKLTILRGGWLKMKEPIEPANQLAVVHRVMTVGNLCASARRHLGVVTAIS
jgi:hypothetical protein